MKRMLKTVLRLLACAVLLAAIGGTMNGCVKPEKEPLPKTNIAPPALEPQAEPNDAGELITYKVNGTISSDMVVQRNAYFNVFGRADQTKGYIYGEFMGEKRYAKIEKDGSFNIKFSSHEATAEPQTLKVYPKNGEVTEFTDILVGDVWIMSGQSNGELSYSLARAKLPKYDKEISGDDLIRVFSQAAQDVLDGVNNNTIDATVPHEDILNANNCWKKATLANVQPFSAIGYYFGKELSKLTNVPLGLIMTAAGGAAIQELMPESVAKDIGYTAGAMVPLSGHYNTLMAPFTKNRITGMVFCQGESESGGEQYTFYAEHLAKTVEGYREIWGIEFPFINIQLSSYGIEGTSMWPYVPLMRAAQFDAAKIIPNYYIVTSMDRGYKKGDPEWAHPLYKFDVGYRAAQAAAYVSYGVGQAEYMLAPEPESVTFGDDGTIIVRLKNVGDGITLAEGDEIAGIMPYYSYGGKMKCEVSQLDAFTIKIIPKETPYSVRYGMMQDATSEAANIMSSTGIAMPAWEVKNPNYSE